jgi:toxin-antitoxin system PIN domain toxin
VFVVDTNLLVYAADEDIAGQRQMQGVLLQWGSSPEAWYVTWSIVYEFLSVTTQRSVFKHPLTFSEAWSFIEELRNSPSFEILVETNRHAEIVRDLANEYPHISGGRLHDLHIVAIMKEHGIAEIRTADSDFHQFKFLRVINPLH